MNHSSSLLLQIPQPCTSTYRNGTPSNSPMPQDRLSPQLHKPNPKRFYRSIKTLHSHNNSPKIFVRGDRLPIIRDLSGNIPATPTTCKRAAVTEEKIEELSRGISGLYVKGRGGRQRGLNFNSTTTRGGSGLFGSLVRKPGRFKVRTIVLGGTTKVEDK